jgi:ElaB/YqjD/DUF883 family membrane-anchored ribosome-binding protein
MLADVSDAVALFKILFFVAFIAVWIGVRSHVKGKVNKLANPRDKAESLLESASKDIEDELAKLRSDLSAKDERVRSGSSPLQVNTIEQRNRALNDVVRAFEDAKNNGTILERANKLQEVLRSYIRLSIDINLDTVEELEALLKAAEAVQIQKGSSATEASISDLRGHTTSARNALESALKATDPKAGSSFVASAEKSLKSGFTVVNALRLIGAI